MADTTAPCSTQVKLEPGHGARLAMFSARFNEKNKEACIAVVTRIRSPKFFCTHHIYSKVMWNKNLQESSYRIALSTFHKIANMSAGTAVGSCW